MWSYLDDGASVLLTWWMAVQVLGQLYSKMPDKAVKSLARFKEAAARLPKSLEVWEMLAELLAATDPAGTSLDFI